jgi:hypothetical protein
MDISSAIGANSVRAATVAGFIPALIASNATGVFAAVYFVGYPRLAPCLNAPHSAGLIVCGAGDFLEVGSPNVSLAGPGPVLGAGVLGANAVVVGLK